MPNTVAISEPEVLMEFSHEKTFDHFPKTQRDLLLRACIRLLFKSASQSKGNKKPNEIDCLVIKPKAHGIFIAQDLNYLYPKMKHLYMYRHPAEYVRSVRSVYNSLLHPIVRHLMIFSAFNMDMNGFIMRQFGQKCDNQESAYVRKMTNALDQLDTMGNLEQRFSALFCGNILSFMKILTEVNNNIQVVSYHELTDNTHSNMKLIRKHCEIESESEVEESDDNFVICLPENDSQNNSGLSRNRLRSFQTVLKDKEICVVDEVLQLCGFPPCEKFPLDAAGFTKLLGISRPDVITSQHNGHTNELLPRYDSEAYLKIRTSPGTSPKSVSKFTDESEFKTIHPPLVTNKSLWLPVNRFF